MKKKVVILKLGGSIVTRKNTKKMHVHRKRISAIAQNIARSLRKEKEMQLIIIHGAGGPGHHLAHQYALAEGTAQNKNKLHGALLSRLANQKLDTEIFDILVSHGVPVVPVHTGSIIVQDSKKIRTCNTDIMHHAMHNGYIPMIYGEMTFDEKLGLSVCSGDASAAYLAQHFHACKVLFATDTDGIYTKDPHKNKDARLIPAIDLHDILFHQTVELTTSHNTDVTGGLHGKLHSFSAFAHRKTAVEEVVIFNGTLPKNFYTAITNQPMIATRIIIKK